MGDSSARLGGMMDGRLMAELLTAGGKPWALIPESMEFLAAAVEAGVVLSGPFPEAPAPRRAGKVAVVPLNGVITPDGGGMLGALLGMGGGLTTFRQELGKALTDDSIDEIVIDVNSPGGITSGVPEMAGFLRAARERKPIKAVANTTAGSAGYWLASQAEELIVAPSGEVGSIGAYMLHQDTSKALEDAGVKVTLTAAGKYKTEGNKFEPLSDEAAAARQEKVDLFYDKFVDDVARGRGVSKSDVISGYGEGRTLLAEQAVAAGLADRVGTLEEVVGQAIGTAPAPEAIAAQADEDEEPEVGDLEAVKRMIDVALG